MANDLNYYYYISGKVVVHRFISLPFFCEHILWNLETCPWPPRSLQLSSFYSSSFITLTMNWVYIFKSCPIYFELCGLCTKPMWPQILPPSQIIKLPYLPCINPDFSVSLLKFIILLRHLFSFYSWCNPSLLLLMNNLEKINKNQVDTHISYKINWFYSFNWIHNYHLNLNWTYL